jgi:hypothetical protein
VPAWVIDNGALAWRPLWAEVTHLRADAGTLVTRIVAWAGALARGSPRFDPVAVAFVWTLGLWGVSGWAGWLIYRRRGPLLALTPGGVLLMLAFSHVWGSHVFLLLLLLGGLLLLAVVSYDGRTQRWDGTGVDYPELQLDTVAVTLFLALGLVTSAHLIPAIPVQRLAELARSTGKGRSEAAEAVADSLGMEERTRTVLEEVVTGGLPRRHLVGGSPRLSERVVMIISTGDLPPGPPASVGDAPPRYGWRSHSYDLYTGSGWLAGDMVAVEYPAGTVALTRTFGYQRMVRQEVQVKGDVGGLLYAAGTLMGVDHAYQLAWRSPDDPFGATIRATSYVADSLVPIANEYRLRSQSSDYPEWVRERYLALPASVPGRVETLARDLTATEPTLYGRARAIETYLRRFPYTLDVPFPPGDRDVVDYFLFDLQRGYCDYFASAMTVLARAAGLPARLAVGYASGTYDWERARYLVTEADAHAWPEIYFPGHGWVGFEPTSGFAAVEHTDSAALSEWAEPMDPLQPAPGGWALARRAWWRMVCAAVAVLGLAGAGWWGLDRWRLGNETPVAALVRLYARLRRSGRWLQVPMQAGDTPHEFGASFAEQLRTIARRRPGASADKEERWSVRGLGRAAAVRVDAAVVEGAEDVAWLAGLYARASYSPRALDTAERARAVRVWSSLRWRLQLARLWKRFQPP